MVVEEARLIYSSDPEDNGYEWDSKEQLYVRREDGETYFWDGEFEWDTFESNFKRVFDNTDTLYVAYGYLGLWNGRHGAGKMIEDFDDLQRSIWGRSIEDVEIYDENGDLVVYMRHHDGTNVMRIRELTKKGYQYYLNHPYEDVTSHIANTAGYTRAPRFADRVYGPVTSKNFKLFRRPAKKKTAAKDIPVKKSGAKKPSVKKPAAKPKTPAKKPAPRKKPAVKKKAAKR